MKLSEIISADRYAEVDVAGMHYDSRKIKKGYVFFAIPGYAEDGAKYIESALKNGAIAFVVGKGVKIPFALKEPVIEVPDVRRSLAEAASRFYKNPSNELPLKIGVTGTKGKTSTSFLLESILKSAKKHPVLVGGVECRYEGESIPSTLTTLDSLDLQSFLRRAVDGGAESLAMEISSHALSLDRVWGLSFDGVIFTNLSEDHLDFYSKIENYFEAKKLLFKSPYRKGPAAVNIDNAYGERIMRECPGDWITYGLQKGEITAKNIICTDRGIEFTVVSKQLGEFHIRSPLAGEFNVLNILGAVAMAIKLNISLPAIMEGIQSLKSVPGRIERVETELPFSVFVDFAHMGLALDNVLKALRPLCRGKIILVVGAGGDKAVERRTQIGGVAANSTEFTVITSDNPRSEDPAKIISMVEQAYLKSGGKKENYAVRPDRKEAIQLALSMAQSGDVVCIAGKGHETGQIVGNKVYPFDDRVEAANFLRELEKNFGVDTVSKN